MIGAHALLVLTTGATSLSQVMRRFSPRRIIFDQASQMTESLTVAIVGRFRSNLQHIAMVGDNHRGTPYQPNNAVQGSEFANVTSYSLFDRLLTNKFPKVELKKQYRMHPDISGLLSHVFYSGELKNHDSVLNREGHEIWYNVLNKWLPKVPRRHSVFLDVSDSHPFQQVVKVLKAAGAAYDRIAIITPYAAQRQLHDSLKPADVHTATIDGCHGKEYDFVVLDLVTPGGRAYSFAFVNHSTRACVALSRAKIGQVVVGNKSMWTDRRRTESTKRWENVVRIHEMAGTLKTFNIKAEDVMNMKSELGIPGQIYEVKKRRS